MLLFAQLGILALLVMLDIWLGLGLNFYYTVWWWDMPAHFLGGVWAGLFVAWLLRKGSSYHFVLKCTLGALAIGVCWEIFEYSFGIGGSLFMSYWADTIKDLCMDTLGGATAGLVVYMQRNVLWRR